MSVHRLVITSSLILCAWLMASYMYANPNELLRALNDKNEDVRVSSQPQDFETKNQQAAAENL